MQKGKREMPRSGVLLKMMKKRIQKNRRGEEKRGKKEENHLAFYRSFYSTVVWLGKRIRVRPIGLGKWDSIASGLNNMSERRLWVKVVE